MEPLVAAGVIASIIGIRRGSVQMPKLIRVVTAAPDRRDADEAVEYVAEAVDIRHTPEGVSISPRSTHENTLGFLSLFYPWREVRQIKEFDRAG